MRRSFLHGWLFQRPGEDASGRGKARFAAIAIASATLGIFGWAPFASISAQPWNSSPFPPPRALLAPPRPAPLAAPPPPTGAPAAEGPAAAIVPVPLGLPIVGGSWIHEGPAATQPGQDNAFNSESSGAIKAIVTSGNVVYIGAVNGGIWKTTNATAIQPTWTPLTDSQRSLSIGDLQFDPTDSTNNTLLAGIGRYSALALFGGPLLGLLRTTNGGETWTLLNGGGKLTGSNISAVAARGATIVAAASYSNSGACSAIGVFRSTNTGALFTRTFAGAVWDLVGGPNDNSVLYMAVTFAGRCGSKSNGVYKSTNTGATWTRVSNSAMNALFIDNTTDNARISVGTGNNVYVSIDNRGQLAGLFRSGDGGSTWTSLDTPAINRGGQGTIHSALVADPNNANLAYIAGDLQPDFAPSVFRVDASQPRGSQATSLTEDFTANFTSPHADTRSLVVDADGNLLLGGDGGIYLRSSPQTNNGDWFALSGNLQITEAHDTAFDQASQIIFAGTQDNGTPMQPNPDSTLWTLLFGGDGGDVEVDTTSVSPASIRYGSAQFLEFAFRATFDLSNNLVAATFLGLDSSGNPERFQPQFYTPIKLNVVDPTRILIGGKNALYESTDQGDTLIELSPPIKVNDQVDHKALVYGGFQGSTANPFVIYAGTFAGSVAKPNFICSSGRGQLYARTTETTTLKRLTRFPASVCPNAIAVDPSNYMSVYVAGLKRLVHSSNGGRTWSNITGNLIGGSGAASIDSITFVSSGSTPSVVVGTNVGVFQASTANLGSWSQLGTGLPNVLIPTLDFNSANNLLVAGTIGRGTFELGLGSPAP